MPSDSPIAIMLPKDEVRELAAGILERAIEKGGVAEAIKTAALSSLAARGLLDKATAAKFLGIKERTLEMWMLPVAQGGKGVPHMKIGETVRFRIESLEAWAEQYEVNKVLPKVA